jgi:hypothetical protein
MAPAAQPAVVNRQEALRRHLTRSRVVAIAQVVAQLCAFAGVVAAFWHITWIAGVAILVSGPVGVVVHTVGYTRLERDREPTPRDGEAPDASGS